MALAPQLLRLHLPPSWIEPVEARHARAQHTFLHIRTAVRIAGIHPPWVVLYDLRQHRQPPAQATLQILIRHLGLHEIRHEVLGNGDILRPFWDETAARTQHGRHRLAVVAVRQAHHHHIFVIGLLVLEHRQFGRQGPIEVHDEQPFVIGVIVVGIVPAQRFRRDEAFFVGVGHELDRVNRGLPHFGIVGVQHSVFGNDPGAAVGVHEMLEQVVAVVRPDGGDLQADAVNLAHAFGTQRRLHGLEEIPELVPGVRRVRQLEAGFGHEAAPNMERRAALLDRREIESAALLNLVVIGRCEQRGFAQSRPVGFDDIADIDKLIVPGMLRQDRFRRAMENQIRHVAACQRGDRLLVQCRERHDTEFDLVAGELLVVRDGFAEGDVLLLDEALPGPNDGGCSRGVGKIGARQRAYRG